MKNVTFRILVFLLTAAIAVGTVGCARNDVSSEITNSSNAENDVETYTVHEGALWYLASDDTADYTGDIKPYSTDEYSSLLQWAQNNQGIYLVSAEETEKYILSFTVSDSQKEKLQELVQKKYEQARNELSDICSLFAKAEISESDPKEFDIYFDPDAWLGTDTLSAAGLTDFENLLIMGYSWQLLEELENGSDFVGTIVWKNANTGYKLLTLSSDPNVTTSFSAPNAAIRHTNYSDYEGTLDFTAKYIGEFTDNLYDGTFYEFEITNEASYKKGEKVCFYVDELPIDVSEDDEVYVTFSGDNEPHDYAFDSHDQSLCFDKNVAFTITLGASE